MRTLLISLILFALCEGVTKADEQALLERMPNSASLTDPQVRILLVRVRSVEVTKEVFAEGQIQETGVKYQALILANHRDQPRAGSEVSIVGHLNHGGSLPNNAPIARQAEVVLLVVTGDAAGHEFDYAGEATLPFGLESPCVVAEPQVATVTAALSKFGELTHDGRGNVTREQTAVLMRDRNDYVWAIGAAALAIAGSPRDARQLVEAYADERTNLRRLLWLDFVCASLLPEASELPLNRRHELMVENLRRIAR